MPYAGAPPTVIAVYCPVTVFAGINVSIGFPLFENTPVVGLGSPLSYVIVTDSFS